MMRLRENTSRAIRTVMDTAAAALAMDTVAAAREREREGRREGEVNLLSLVTM